MCYNPSAEKLQFFFAVFFQFYIGVDRYFPEQIKSTEARITGLKQDIETFARHPHPKDGFAGMTVLDVKYGEKEAAGAALMAACADIAADKNVTVGSYRGFALLARFDGFSHKLTLQGRLSYELELGDDPRGNVTRIDNGLEKLPVHLDEAETQLTSLRQQLEDTRAELGKPFLQEEELKRKSARLVELDALLNMDSRKSETEDAA